MKRWMLVPLALAVLLVATPTTEGRGCRKSSCSSGYSCAPSYCVVGYRTELRTVWSHEYVTEKRKVETTEWKTEKEKRQVTRQDEQPMRPLAAGPGGAAGQRGVQISRIRQGVDTEPNARRSPNNCPSSNAAASADFPSTRPWHTPGFGRANLVRQ